MPQGRSGCDTDSPWFRWALWLTQLAWAFDQDETGSPGGVTMGSSDQAGVVLDRGSVIWSRRRIRRGSSGGRGGLVVQRLPPEATGLVGLTAEITVPGLTCGVKFLRVHYDPSIRHEPTLRREWADEYTVERPLAVHLSAGRTAGWAVRPTPDKRSNRSADGGASRRPTGRTAPGRRRPR